MKIIEEFKEFAIKGNAFDLAVAVVIGNAFGKIVSSLVSDILMPPIGLLLGKVDFKDLRFVLKEATASSSEVAINYGVFLQTVIDFLIVAFAIFSVIKFYNKIRTSRKEQEDKSKEEKKIIQLSSEEKLLTEIRDILKQK